MNAVWRWSGSTLIGVGILMAVVAGAYYTRFALYFRLEDSTDVGHSLIFGGLFSCLLGGGGVFLLVMVATALK